MMLEKRTTDSRVEKIKNGYIVEVCGRNEASDWEKVKVFYISLGEVAVALKDYFDLPLDN